ncbi:MAG: hypothetical protein HXY34_07330 [Candidatus Thorarchaeota archaeon]|nr:hypothetical protein [Candidatus Thorarchaeota archaeon]
MDESLKDMLKHGRRFERVKTSIDGVFIRRIPQSRDEPACLVLEVNPIGRSGNPMNRVGSIIRNMDELNAIRAILSQESVDEIMVAIERANRQSQPEHS